MFSSFFGQTKSFFQSYMTSPVCTESIPTRRIWIEGTFLQRELQKNLCDQASDCHGVFVLNLPSGSGKTRITRHCVDQAVANGDFRKSYYIDCKGEQSLWNKMKTVFLEDPNKQLVIDHVIPEMTPEEYNRRFEKGYKVLIVLDHIEECEDTDQLQRLACTAVNAPPSKAFNVLCLTNNDQVAEDILRRDDAKAHPVFRLSSGTIQCKLTGEEIKAYAPELKDDLLDLAKMAGTFEFCDRISTGEHFKMNLVKQAHEVAAQWNHAKDFVARASEARKRSWDEYEKRCNEWVYGEKK